MSDAPISKLEKYIAVTAMTALFVCISWFAFRNDDASQWFVLGGWFCQWCNWIQSIHEGKL